MSDYWSQFEGKSVPLKGLLQWLSDEHDHVTDDEGELQEGWDFPVVNSMALERWAKAEAIEAPLEYWVEARNTHNGLSNMMNKEPITSLFDAQKYRDWHVQTDKVFGSTNWTYRIVSRPRPEDYKEVTK